MSYMHVSKSRNEFPSPSRRDSNANFRYNDAQRQVGPSSGNQPDSNFGGPQVQQSSDLTYLLNQKRHELDNLNSKMQVTDPKFYNMVKQYEKELGAFQRSRVEETSPVRYNSENPHVNDKENEKLRRLQWIEQERLKRQGSAPNYNDGHQHQPERRSRHEEYAAGGKSSIEERYNEELGYRNGHHNEKATPQSHKKGPLIARDMEKVIGSVELYGDNMRNKQREIDQSDLFSKMGKYYDNNEAEKKRRYREELDQMMKQKNNSNNGNQSNKDRRQDNQRQIEFNKENRPSNAQEVEHEEPQLDWNKKNRMADEVMNSLLQKGRGSQNQNQHQYQSQGHHPVNNTSEIYSIPASTPRRTPRKGADYDHSPQQRGDRSSERPRDNFGERRRDVIYDDYEQRNRESIEKSVELDKKRRYRQELDAQMEERKRIQSAKPGAREEVTRTSVSESQDRRPTTSNSNKPNNEFSLFKAQEEADNRQKQKNLDMQKYAEDLKKQMQEKEERKKQEKKKMAEEEAREEQKAQRLVQQAIEKNSDIQPPHSQYQSNMSPYHSPHKNNQDGMKSRSRSPVKNEQPPFEYEQQQRPGNDNLQTGQFPNPYEKQQQQQQPNMPPSNPYGNPLMGNNYFNPLQAYGNYPGQMMPGYPMYPAPYWMPGPMYGVPPYPDMTAYRNHMMQIMEERVRMERIAMQEKLMYQKSNANKGNDDGNLPSRSPNRGGGRGGLQYNQTPSPVRKQSQNMSDFGDHPLQFMNVMNAPFANSHLFGSQLHPDNDLQNSVLKNVMGNSRQFNDQYIEPDSLEQSYQQLNKSLPSTNLNFEIPPQQLEQSFNKDLNIFKVLHQKAFQLTPEKSATDMSPAPKSQTNASPINERGPAAEESKEPIHERETVISIIPPSERGTANPSMGINHYSTLLQYSQSIDNPTERTTVKSNIDGQKPRIESGLFYTVDNMGVMITPHGDPNIGTFGKMDSTPQVIYRLSPSLMTEGDNKALSSNKEPSKIQEEDDENYLDKSKHLREQTGRFGLPDNMKRQDAGDRMIKPLVRGRTNEGKLDTARSDSEKSFEDGKTPVEAVEQKLEMKLVEMDEVRSLIVAEDDESAYYDEEVMKEFAESHDKILQEIRMDLKKNIKSDNTNSRFERIAVVESSREGTEQELLDIVREAKKAVGIVEKATVNPEKKRPVSPAARQNFRQNSSPLKLEKAVSMPEKQAAVSPTEDVSPSKRQKVGGIVEKAMAMPDKKRPLSPVSRQAIQESQSPLRLDSRPPLQNSRRSPLKVETEFDEKNMGSRMDMTTPKSSDAFRTTKEGKRYRSPKTIDPFARAATSMASVKSAPIEEKNPVEVKSMGKADSSNEDRFNSRKKSEPKDVSEKEKEESIEEEISLTAMEEEEKVFEQYDKEIKSQEIGSSVQGKDQWDILDILKDNQDGSEKISSIADDKKKLSEIEEQGDQREIETDGDRSRSMISIGKPKSPNIKRDRSRGIESELKEIEERLNRQPSRQGRPKTSQTEKSLVDNFGKSKSNFHENKSIVKDKSQDVIEIQTANWEDLRPEMILGSKVVAPVEEKSEGRVANEKRSKAILTKLEKLLDGWIGEDSEKENNAENNDYSIEVGDNAKPISSSQQIFRPVDGTSRRSLSKRYSEGEDY